MPALAGAAAPSRRRFAQYLELTKARLSALVVLTTAAGYAVSSTGSPSWGRLGWTIFGTALSAGGANALNEWMESDLDAQMERTSHRPLPSGRMSRAHGLAIALMAALLGPTILLAFTNALTAGLAAFTILLYVLVYTPLKRRSTACTLVGALCGAIPPMMGCSAAVGHLGSTAWFLFALLFLWQIPHFLALAWLYREDYARVGFKMFPLLDEAGGRTGRLMVLYALALVPLGFAMALSGLGGWLFVLGSIALALGFTSLGFQFLRDRSSARARRVFFASLIYLPLVLSLLVVDRGPVPGLALLRPGSFTVSPSLETIEAPSR